METTIFILKLIITPLIVAGVTWIARKWGESIGGLLIGLPLTSGPVSVFLAVEQGPHFATNAANSAILGLIPVTAFYITYIQSAKHFSWYLSALYAICAYFVVVVAISVFPINIYFTTIVVPLILLLGTMTLGKRMEEGTVVPPPAWDLPARMILATGLLVLITGAANTLGSKWSGLLSPFPIFTFVMVTFAHRQGGADAAKRFIQGVSLGLFSYVAFFLVVRSLVEKADLWIVYLLAAMAALVVNGLFLGFQVWRKQALLIRMK